MRLALPKLAWPKRVADLAEGPPTQLDDPADWLDFAARIGLFVVTRVKPSQGKMLSMCHTPSWASGSLYYIIGASGAGKDSLLHYARSRCAKVPLMFAHRYITRPASAGGEDHIAVSAEVFARLRDAGAFSLHWRANGLEYGVGIEVSHWLAAGLDVVLNGSRAHLPQACACFPTLEPILIQVSPERLGERLRARGRESEPEVLARIERAHAMRAPAHPRLRVVCNDDQIEQAGEKLLSLITRRMGVHTLGD